MRLTIDEIEPGLVVFCDPDTLAAHERTWITDYREKCVQDPHFFIVLRRHTSGRWILTPIFSRTSRGRIELDQALKTGRSNRWLDNASFVYRWEQWLVPADGIVEASDGELTKPEGRNRYADAAPTALAKLAQNFDDNLKPLLVATTGDLVD